MAKLRSGQARSRKIRSRARGTKSTWTHPFVCHTNNIEQAYGISNRGTFVTHTDRWVSARLPNADEAPFHFGDRHDHDQALRHADPTRRIGRDVGSRARADARKGKGAYARG